MGVFVGVSGPLSVEEGSVAVPVGSGESGMLVSTGPSVSRAWTVSAAYVGRISTWRDGRLHAAAVMTNPHKHKIIGNGFFTFITFIPPSLAGAIYRV
jgi:hypothetical protein